ncbi:HAD-IA family hydrolase [Candidatus Nomurabacteria bacterium]|nr:HAD-IA family hydrolase [Candidatus Nomurabacteria bacterium]
MIKAVSFDFDGVLYHETTPLMTTRLLKDYPNVNEEKVLEFFQMEFADCQAGIKDMKEVLTRRLPEWNFPGTLDELLHYWFDDGSIDDQVLKLIEMLKERNLLCVLCTNNEIHRWNFLKEKYKLNMLFDEIFCSAETKLRKPDPKVYKNITKTLQLKPEEIFMTDDDEKAAAAAASIGMQAHHFQNLTDFQSDLSRLLED